MTNQKIIRNLAIFLGVQICAISFLLLKVKNPQEPKIYPAINKLVDTRTNKTIYEFELGDKAYAVSHEDKILIGGTDEKLIIYENGEINEISNKIKVKKLHRIDSRVVIEADGEIFFINLNTEDLYKTYEGNATIHKFGDSFWLQNFNGEEDVVSTINAQGQKIEKAKVKSETLDYVDANNENIYTVTPTQTGVLRINRYIDGVNEVLVEGENFPDRDIDAYKISNLANSIFYSVNGLLYRLDLTSGVTQFLRDFGAGNFHKISDVTLTKKLCYQNSSGEVFYIDGNTGKLLDNSTRICDEEAVGLYPDRDSKEVLLRDLPIWVELEEGVLSDSDREEFEREVWGRF